MRTSHRPSRDPALRSVGAALEELAEKHVIERLWARDHRLWKSEPTEIDNRLGWLTVAEHMREHAGMLHEFGRSAREAGMQDVVLLGMGGSSLGPEVLRCTFGSLRGFPRLWVLDSTVPRLVRHVTESIHPAQTLFLVASKSGGTIEVMSLFAHFWDLVSKAKSTRGGSQFIAITDPHTGLEKLATDYHFWQTFTNPPDIGGRYSVLSFFGLVPAALLGLDVSKLIERGIAMASACRKSAPPADNPGAYLGAVMGAMGREGRDKITVVASPRIDAFGLWAEQLIAESTGKEGKGLIPIAQEPLASPPAYGTDRVFIYLRLHGDANQSLDRQIQILQHAGQPVVRLTLNDRYDVAGEFFRWEFATAIAGSILGIHPFDQPNVQESKDNTGRVLKEVEATGRLPQASRAPSHMALKTLLANPGSGRYLAILAYMTPSRLIDSALRTLRKAILTSAHIATTNGYGPRYLHSTGQLHKGGPKTGLFLQLLEDMTPDLSIPGKGYTFGTLAQAQAAGDLQSLEVHGRAVMSVRLGKQPIATIKAMARTLAPSRKQTGSAKTKTAKSRHK
ncbi:MAG: glucose-6-phosphate isomerase [Nitrospiraceae bacterium]